FMTFPHRMTRLRFQVDARANGSRARAARFQTLHAEVLTPVFMPVGTHATVKGLSVEDLEAAGSRVLLAFGISRVPASGHCDRKANISTLEERDTCTLGLHSL
ncbi:MAG: hypothetical protein ACREQL_10155, partial [Candidatus Binatia bacterium]